MSNQFVRRKANKNYRYEDDEAAVGLLDGSDNEDVGNEDGISLQARRKHHVDFIEHEVKEGDTLSSLSLQYNCTISQIKQLNCIHRDNEIFALHKIRIPVLPFSVVTERIGKAQSTAAESAQSADNSNESDKLESGTLPEGIVIDSPLYHFSSDIDSSSDTSVCNPLKTPLPVPLLLNPSSIDHSIEDVQTSIELSHSGSPFLQCNGADCGIPWLTLFVCTLGLGFVGPLIYIFFLYENNNKPLNGFHHS